MLPKIWPLDHFRFSPYDYNAPKLDFVNPVSAVKRICKPDLRSTCCQDRHLQREDRFDQVVPLISVMQKEYHSPGTLGRYVRFVRYELSFYLI